MGLMAVSRAFVKDRIFGGMWAGVWMLPLLQPAVTVTQGRVSHSGWAGTALAAFVVIYLVVVTNGFDVQRPRATTVDLVMLGVVAANGFTLLVAYGYTRDSWANVAIYIAVAG